MIHIWFIWAYLVTETGDLLVSAINRFLGDLRGVLEATGTTSAENVFLGDLRGLIGTILVGIKLWARCQGLLSVSAFVSSLLLFSLCFLSELLLFSFFSLFLHCFCQLNFHLKILNVNFVQSLASVGFIKKSQIYEWASKISFKFGAQQISQVNMK